MSMFKMFGVSVFLMAITLVGLYFTGDPVMSMGTSVATL